MIRDRNNVRAALAKAGSMGRGKDNQMVHAGPGEVLIPPEVIDTNPQVMAPLIKAFQKAGMDWRRYLVGTNQNSRNPQTGAREFKYGADTREGGAPGRDTPDRDPSRDRDSGYGGSESGKTGFEGSPEHGGSGTRETYGYDPSAPADNDRDQVERRFRETFKGGFSVPGYSPPDMEPGDKGYYDYLQEVPLNKLHMPAQLMGGMLKGLGKVGDTLTDFYGGFDDLEYGAPTPPGPGDIRDPSRDRDREVAPTEPADPGYGQLDDPGMPDYLEFDPNMTPLQMRTLIANMGLNSDDTRYMTEETQAYYKYLLYSDLLEAGDLSGLTPIEQQYLREVMGYEWTTYDELMNLLNPGRGPGNGGGGFPGQGGLVGY